MPRARTWSRDGSEGFAYLWVHALNRNILGCHPAKNLFLRQVGTYCLERWMRRCDRPHSYGEPFPSVGVLEMHTGSLTQRCHPILLGKPFLEPVSIIHEVVTQLVNVAIRSEVVQWVG